MSAVRWKYDRGTNTSTTWAVNRNRLQLLSDLRGNQSPKWESETGATVASPVIVGAHHSASMGPMQSPAYRQLTEIAALPDGWDGEDAERPTAYAIARAFYLIDLVRRGTGGVEPVASMPLPDGGLQIEWQENGRRFEAEVDAAGAVSLLEVDLRGPSHEYLARGSIGLRDAAESIARVLIGA